MTTVDHQQPPAPHAAATRPGPAGERTTDPDAVRAAIIAALPVEATIVEPARMAGYRFDRAADPDAGTPIAVVRPTTTAEVQAVVRIAAEHGVPVVTRGAGSGLSGGATARDGAILLTTERMRDITVDPATRTAVVQPGLLNAEVKTAAAANGLWYPPDPSSFELCSIGGNVATNAGGLCCVKYGVTSDYVLGLEVVLADGTAVRLGGPRQKDVAGLSLTKLFVGSEGTLGIVTEATLRLVPAQGAANVAVAFFANVDDATGAVAELTRRCRPSMVEFMDGVSIRAVEAVTRMGLDTEAEAMLLVGVDTPGDAGLAELATVESILTEHGADDVFVADDPEMAEQFVHARRQAIPCVEKLGSLLLEDVGVPLPALGDLIRGVAEIAARNAVVIAVVAHAGDGNTHPLIVHDAGDPVQVAAATTAFGEVMDLAIALGGTITGEHGVGRLKRAWLEPQIGADAMALTRRIKTALDPNGLFNPGVLL